MKSIITRELLLILALIVTFSACKDDDEPTTNPSGTSNAPKTKVEVSELLNGTYTTTLNPSGKAPLTAAVSFSTTENTTVEMTVLGSIPVSNEFDAVSSSHNLDILGLYPNTNNRLALKISTSNQYALDTIDLPKTDSIPSIFPTVEIVSATPSLMEDGMNLNNLSITDGTNFQPYPMIYDRNGDIRWYLDLANNYPAAGFVSPFKPIDGGLLLAEVGDKIIEFDMMGREETVVTLPSVYHSHHDVSKLPNGNYAVAVSKTGSQMMYKGVLRSTVEDIFIEVSPTGALVEEWDLKEILDVDRLNIVNFDNSDPAQSIDWFHQNALYYSESDDSFILSGRNQGVVKVGRNNELKWILSPHKGWGNSGADGNGYSLDSLLLTAVNASGTAYDTSIQNGNTSDPGFDWPWGQHAPMILPNGNIAMFDNGVNRFYTDVPGSDNGPNYSKYVEYEIDESSMKVKQVHAYGESRGAEAYSLIISDVDYLPNTGNVLFCPGVSDGFTTSRIIELTRPGMSPVFEGKLTFKNELSTGGGFGKFDITYRAERIKLYR